MQVYIAEASPRRLILYMHVAFSALFFFIWDEHKRNVNTCNNIIEDDPFF